MVDHPNQLIKRERLIDAVWGYSGGIGSNRIVDVHIRHLREKLEDDPAEPRLIQTFKGVGYVFED